MSKYKIEPIYDTDTPYDDEVAKVMGFQVIEEINKNQKKILYWGGRSECLHFLAKMTDKE